MPQFVPPPPQTPALIQPESATAKTELRAAKNAVLLGSPIYTGYDRPAPYFERDRDRQTFKRNTSWHLTHLITRSRSGQVRKFKFELVDLPDRSVPIADNGEDTQNTPLTPSPTIVEPITVVEILADRQEYDEKRKVIIAIGNVEMRYSSALLTADRLRVNLSNRIAVAEGNVVLKRGEQVLRGDRMEYSFFVDKGIITTASGEIFQPTVNRDVSFRESDDGIPDRPLTDRLSDRQPLRRVNSAGGYRFVAGSTRDLALLERSGGLPVQQTGGQVNRLRFEADRIDFDAEGWVASNLRFTNDPFSPPELEVQADTATYNREIQPGVDELLTTNSRIVFDQTVPVPLFTDRFVIDRRPRRGGLVRFGYDGEDRGGLFVERNFEIVDTEEVRFDIAPQYYIQRAVSDRNSGIVDSSAFGFKTKLESFFGARTTLDARADLTSLDFNNNADDLEANVRLRQRIGPLNQPHTLSLEYNYRDRLFNGSLGFQRVQNSFGALLTSPVFILGETGIYANYQTSIQNINANSDRQDLIRDNKQREIINLTRYQGATSFNRDFNLWQGEALPPTKGQGLRFTPVPVRPFLQFNTNMTGVTSFYSNGDNQSSLRFRVGLLGQFGNFSRSFFDYTGFNIGYTQGIISDRSPFLFDRFADPQTFLVGITQQIYGPLRVGFQTSRNLDNGDEISTDYFVEYSRRTYNVLVRYNPVLEIGSISLRISDFNWIGSPEPFDGSGIRQVTDGVKR